MIPVAAIVLMLPTYWLSYWIELWSLRRGLPGVPAAVLRKGVWRANALSYGGLLLILLVQLAISLSRR
jgi:hypothetical protein